MPSLSLSLNTCSATILPSITNGNFSGVSGTGWTVGLSGGTGSVDFSVTGQAGIKGDGTNNGYIEQRITHLIPGATYVITLTSVNTVAVTVGSAQGGSDLATKNVNTSGATASFVASGGTAWLRIARGSTSAAFVSAISIQKQ